MCKPEHYLTLDTEQDLARLIRMEAETHRLIEPMKQNFESMMEYSPDAAYKCIDD